jgi:hypothetical protein
MPVLQRFTPMTKEKNNDSATPTSRDDFLKESQLFSIPLGGLITAALRHTSNVK